MTPRPRRTAFAAGAALLLGAASFPFYAWLLAPRPLWTRSLPTLTWSLGAARDGGAIVVQGPHRIAADETHPVELHGLDGRSGVPLCHWRGPEGYDEVHQHAFTPAGDLHLLLHARADGSLKARLLTLDPRTGQAQDHAFEAADSLWPCRLSDDGRWCVFRRESPRGPLLVRRRLDGPPTEETLPLPQKTTFDLLAVSPNGATAVWSGHAEAPPLAAMPPDLLWVASFAERGVRSYPLPHARAIVHRVRLHQGTPLVQLDVTHEPAMEADGSPGPSRTCPLFDLAARRWLGPTPGAEDGLLDAGPNRLARHDAFVRLPPSCPVLPGSARDAACGVAIWTAPGYPPAKPQLLATPDHEQRGDLQFLDRDRFAFLPLRTTVPPDWLSTAYRKVGLADLAAPTTRQGVRVYHLGKETWEWERFGPEITPNGYCSCQAFLAGGRLFFQHMWEHGNELEAWDYPPAAWRRWAPAALSAATWMLAFLLTVRRRPIVNSSARRAAAEDVGH